jgi:hypothetical protein
MKKLIPVVLLAGLFAVACAPTPPTPPTPTSTPTVVTSSPAPTASPTVAPTVSPFPTVWPSPSRCGFERWSVKTGTDSTVSTINFSTVVPTTVSDLNKLTQPATLPQDTRVPPVETTVYKVSATLVEYKLEGDNDIHMILSDGSKTMIAEIPNPGCVGDSSPLKLGIERARSEFNNKFTASDSFQSANVPVTVTGVGFFDFPHGQTGVADNAVELHPVIDVQFG